MSDGATLSEGLSEGNGDGPILEVGYSLGCNVSAAVGSEVGLDVGPAVGAEVGEVVYNVPRSW